MTVPPPASLQPGPLPPGDGPARRIPSFADLRQHWREDFRANGRSLMLPGFQAVAIYRFGVWVHGLERGVARRALRMVYTLMHVWARNVYGIELPHSVRAGRRLRIGHQSGIVINRHVRLGDDCLVRQNVTIGMTRDDTPRDQAPVIGDRVQIGAGAVILSPARIGDDVTIGPNVVVRGEVPPLSVVLPPEPTIRPGRGAPVAVAGREAAR